MAAAEYAKILAQRQKEAKEAKELKRRRLVLADLIIKNYFSETSFNYQFLNTGLLPFASPSALCPASRVLFRLHAEEINLKKPKMCFCKCGGF